jgi:LPS O-antigen subunit length determinant protein (WzzB/FepE family)
MLEWKSRLVVLLAVAAVLAAALGGSYLGLHNYGW